MTALELRSLAAGYHDALEHHGSTLWEMVAHFEGTEPARELVAALLH